MHITEVRIKLMEEPGERLQAFCSITLDNCFVIRDLKIIEGTHGSFVAMPSRKLSSHCPKCRGKNHLRALYCNQCGSKLRDERALQSEEGRAKLYADIAHPINSTCREMIQEHVISAFRQELERSKQPGYRCRYDDLDGDDELGGYIQSHPAADAPAPPAHIAMPPDVVAPPTLGPTPAEGQDPGSAHSPTHAGPAAPLREEGPSQAVSPPDAPTGPHRLPAGQHSRPLREGRLP